MRLVKFVEFSRKIVCVGRNYRGHIKEMGATAEAKGTPMLFLKPPTALITEGESIQVPKGCKDLHHEVELGIVISRKGKNISQSEAMDFIGGYTICLDMTARDQQSVAKTKGHPWSVSKGFDTSCPVGSFIPKEMIPDPMNLGLYCKVNGVERQSGNTKDMIYPIVELVSYISEVFTLEPGDLILTGTPEGVSQVKHGDIITCGIDNLIDVNFSVVDPNL